MVSVLAVYSSVTSMCTHGPGDVGFLGYETEKLIDVNFALLKRWNYVGRPRLSDQSFNFKATGGGVRGHL